MTTLIERLAEDVATLLAGGGGGGGGGAPTAASYLTLGTNATLTQERVLTGSATVSITDAGAGSTATLEVPDSSIGTTKLGGDITAAGKALLDDANAAAQRSTLGLDTAALQPATAFAPSEAQYLTLLAASGLLNERVLTAGTGVSFVDGGAGSSLTVNVTGAPPTGSAGGDLNGTYPNPSLDAVITRTAANAELGMVAGSATYDAYIYVSGNGASGQFVQMLSGGAGEAELRMVPGAGVDSQIVHVGSGGGDLDITTSLGGNVYVNKATNDVDFTASGQTVARLLHVDAGLDKVGVGTGTPAELLHAAGRLALTETTAPSATLGVGKVYVKSSDGGLYYMDGAGVETSLLGGGSGLSQAQVLARGLGS